MTGWPPDFGTHGNQLIVARQESAMSLQTIASALILAAGIGCLAMIGLVAWVNRLIERGEFR
jgi:hypothetical protein